MHHEEMSGLRRRYQGSPVLVGSAVLSVLAQLYGLYRPAGPATAAWFPGSDKVGHLIGFALPVCLVLLVSGMARRMVVTVVGVFALHAVASELAQHFLYASRTGDALDALADLLGVALGLAAARLLGGTQRLPVTGSGEPGQVRTP